MPIHWGPDVFSYHTFKEQMMDKFIIEIKHTVKGFDDRSPLYS